MPSEEPSESIAGAADGDGEGAGAAAPVRTGGRHAKPRKPLLQRLHMPVGRAVALAAMPSAMLMGSGFASPLAARADQVPDNPFSGTSCVEMPDEEPAQDDAEDRTGRQDESDPQGQREEQDQQDEEQRGQEEEPTPRDQQDGDAGGQSGDRQQDSQPAEESAGSGSGSGSDADEPSQEPSGSEESSQAEAGSGSLLDELGQGLRDLGAGLGQGLADLGRALTPGGGSDQDAEEESDQDTADQDARETSDAGGDAGNDGTRNGDAGGQSGDRQQDSQPAEESAGSGSGSESDATAEEEGEAEPERSTEDEAEAADEAAEDAEGADGQQTGDDAVGEDGKRPFPCPEEKHVAGEDETTPLVLPNDSWFLEASSLTLYGLHYHGVVNVTTADGTTKQVLKYTAEKIDIGDLHQIVDGEDGVRRHVATAPGSTSTFRNGTVTMYTERLQGKLFGLIPITFDPEHPPPLDLPIAHFTDVFVIQAGQFGGELTLQGMDSYITNDGPTPTDR